MYGIDEEALLRAFEIAIIEQFRVGIPDHIIARLDPIELAKAAQEAGEDVDSFWALDVRFKYTVWAMKSRNENVSVRDGSQSILSSLLGLEVIEAAQAVRDHFIAKLARMLMLIMDEFEEDNRSISSYGVDSMIGTESRNWIFKELGLDISFQQLLDPSLTIAKFAEHLVQWDYNGDIV
ncbi:Acyl transferase/acyl hydrolase/lysophospholipase [Penicillium mononematosum]|uniref:Acyl transferase/acyl hydrolase/lysophospholipase n=1 Tax=Penicillium mononematosum TaxID=268346 RepID=UPI00254782B7|nr:Acyl transferase/acyl hydrolase/lysophospholipase [Penicillium mononematosum]KAJ6180375.1 Acyl transferase/acyl hydrolase/lysophospholipase [Penicillium mononematosum]